MNESDQRLADSQTTQLLLAASAGDPQAAQDLVPLVYDELRRLARRELGRERAGQTLQPTALVHEAFLRLVGTRDPGWESRAHFFGAAALAMRRILIDRARSRNRLKHGGGMDRVCLEDCAIAHPRPTDEILAVDEAVEALERDDPRKGRIVNLRYFLGLSNEETAELLGVSLGTIEREWRFIRAYLRSRLGEAPG